MLCFVLVITFSFSQRYFTLIVRYVYLFYIADIVSRCAKSYPQWFAFSFVRKKTHTDKQRYKHTFETKEKEKQTDTEKETETISICLVGPIHVPIHFQSGNIKQKTND